MALGVRDAPLLWSVGHCHPSAFLLLLQTWGWGAKCLHRALGTIRQYCQIVLQEVWAEASLHTLVKEALVDKWRKCPVT